MNVLVGVMTTKLFPLWEIGPNVLCIGLTLHLQNIRLQPH